MALRISFFVLVAVFSMCNAALVDDYDHFAALDPDEKVKLYWTINNADETVSFALDGATTGWVGFGVSTGQGKMDKADMVIGWVKDGKTYLSDRHGVGHNPKIDDRNDYKLISGTENNGRTVIKFSRKIDTCDPQDQKLQEGTTKVIFALNDEDPESPESIAKHTFKGIRSILLLNTQGNRNAPDASWKYFDVLNTNYSLPSTHTTYHCLVKQIPQFDDKVQIVRFDPIVQRGNEGVVHHFIVYACDASVNDSHANFSQICANRANMPPPVNKCYGFGKMIGAWGVGGGAFVYPGHVGFPIGAKHDGRYFFMEVHYDNPTKRADIVDNSGVRFYYTEKIRKYDAGVLMTGAGVSSWMMIPPQQPSWKTIGYCSSQCTKKMLEKSSLPEGGVKFFSAFLHTHLTGTATWTRHIRNGVELPEIARDNNYDFNFQDIQFLQKEVHFKPGDDIIHTCIYNTMKRDYVTVGGEDTNKEMCLNFLFYYPAIPEFSSFCTTVDLQAGAKIFNKYYPELKALRHLWWNAIIRSNKTWTKEMAEDYRNMVDEQAGVLPHAINCGIKNPTNFTEAVKDKYQLPIPKITTPLPKPKDMCDVISSATTIAGWMFSQVIGLVAVFLLI